MKRGLVAQWTRARGYELRCRGFDSLLARTYRFFIIDLSISYFISLGTNVPSPNDRLRVFNAPPRYARLCIYYATFALQRLKQISLSTFLLMCLNRGIDVLIALSPFYRCKTSIFMIFSFLPFRAFSVWTLEKYIRFSFLPFFCSIGAYEVTSRNLQSTDCQDFAKTQKSLSSVQPISLSKTSLPPNMFYYESEDDRMRHDVVAYEMFLEKDEESESGTSYDYTYDYEYESEFLPLSRVLPLPYVGDKPNKEVLFSNISKYAASVYTPGVFPFVQSARFYSNLLPFLAISAIVSHVMSGGNSSFAVRRIDPENNPLRLSDAHAIENLLPTFSQCVSFLKSQSVFGKFQNEEIAHSNYLFVGPSGSGKTFLTQALAGEAGVPLLCAATSELQSFANGPSTNRLRKLFREANRCSPCVVVLEGIELIGSTRKDSVSGNPADLHFFTELLVQVDGVASQATNKNVLIATASSCQNLDPALIRPGRFHKIISLELPNISSRMKILQSFQPSDREDPLEKRWAYFARRTRGFSQADLVSTMNESLLTSLFYAAPTNQTSSGVQWVSSLPGLKNMNFRGSLFHYLPKSKQALPPDVQHSFPTLKKGIQNVQKRKTSSSPLGGVNENQGNKRPRGFYY